LKLAEAAIVATVAAGSRSSQAHPTGHAHYPKAITKSTVAVYSEPLKFWFNQQKVLKGDSFVPMK